MCYKVIRYACRHIEKTHFNPCPKKTIGERILFSITGIFTKPKKPEACDEVRMFSRSSKKCHKCRNQPPR